MTILEALTIKASQAYFMGYPSTAQLVKINEATRLVNEAGRALINGDVK